MELFNDTVVWVLILMIVLTGIAARYWTPLAYSMQAKVKENRKQIAKLEKVFDDLGHALQNFDGKMQKQLDSVEGKVVHLGGDVGKVKHGTHDIEKHVGKLEIKAVVVETKIDAVKHQVDAEGSKLKQIDDQLKQGIGTANGSTLQIDQLQHQVHHLEHVIHHLELKRIDNRIRSNTGRVNINNRLIDHIEHEVQGLLKQEHNGNGNGNGHEHYRNSDRETRLRAVAELESADRKIENLMGETIQIEAGFLGQQPWKLNGSPLAQEYEEHHRKLIEAAQHIFRDVRKYLTHAAILDMEAEGEQINWSRGELFANPTSPEAARAYHQQVKDYFIKLKDAICSSIHEISVTQKVMAS